MASIVTNILAPSVVTKIVSRIRTPATPLANFFGTNIGGSNIERITETVPSYTYDIFDYTRRVANGRLRGAPAGSVAARAIGNNTVTLGRFAQKLPMDYNRISGIRTLGQNAGVIDRLGKTYVEKQATELNRMQSNLRELLMGGLFRGGNYYFFQVGDDLVPSYTSTSAFFGVDLKVPTNNKLIGGAFAAGLPMDTGSNIITATWATAATDIPLQLQAWDAAFQQSTGEPLRHLFCNHTVWNNVIKNDYVRQLAGTAASPYAEWRQENLTASDGSPLGVQVAKIKGLDWISWHISNHGMEVYDGTSAYSFTKTIPDSYVGASIEIGDWLKGVEGSEVVKVNDLAPAQVETGFFSWIMEKADPARFELHTLQNFALELNVPKAWAIARVQ